MKSWRPLTWVILVIQALFIWWLIAGVGGTAADQMEDCTALIGHAKDMCDAGNAGTAIGGGIASFMIILLWALVDIILGVIWLITNKSKRSCPACGNTVKKGVLGCAKCGHDFAAAARGSTA